MARPRTKAAKSKPKSAKSVRSKGAPQRTPSKRTVTRAKGAAPRAPARKTAKSRWVYPLGGGKAEGRADMRNLLGGKGAGLAEMASLGLPVPPGFTITTEVCTYYYAHGKQFPKDLESQVMKALARMGRITGKGFGAKSNPLLVS